MIRRLISTKETKKRMDLAVSKDVRGKWTRIYFPKHQHRSNEQLKRF